jgi:hypothetical protein
VLGQRPPVYTIWYLRKSQADPRILEAAPPGEGDYIQLGQEGIDWDGDGRIAEDGPGGDDPNRNWAADWQPDSVHSDALDCPFQSPEAKAINDFLVAHPNIASLQSYTPSSTRSRSAGCGRCTRPTRCR